MTFVNHPFTEKQVKLVTEIYNTGTISDLEGTILSSKNKRYWLLPVKDIGLVLYDNKTSTYEVLVKTGEKKYDIIGLKFIDGSLTFFGRTQIPNVFDREKLSEYDIWNSPCNTLRNGPYTLELDPIGVPAIYDNNRTRIFPILKFN